MPRRSAGIVLHRRGADGAAEVLLVHPGGPFWARKDAGAWSIPKGEHGDDEEPLAAARREFAEELGVELPDDGGADAVRPLGEVRQKGGKRVTAWAVAGDLDPAAIVSNTFELEWPPRSGRRQAFPEVDRAGWFELAQAREKLLPAQLPFLDRLEALLGG
ncbi:NUDIX domain-containing protein [Conexibacter arvalis]|uniref:Putative NUDIX family NTP pyrophosphohydrolase n=1 Tax=Conexibacter arvalis TaxID=912552 RepID=A0A840IFR9_9ACTN|nr:NUDIX domain-containing protein [Conexibacter arvalis]MBB4663185.1 putative NUDIX family NTP pyrophosphohydrolase [Conexibacter arvalis]